MLIKVAADERTRGELDEHRRHLPRQDHRRVAPHRTSSRSPGAEDKIDALIELLKPIGITEIVRTGKVAMFRGTRDAHGRRRQGARSTSHEGLTDDSDATLEPLKGKKIAVIGYGSQGHAHALNLRDSGIDVARRAAARQRVVAEGRERRAPRASTPRRRPREADVVMILVPDELGAEIYEREIAPGLKTGKYLAFGHGFNIHFKKIVPPADVNVFMVAPKGPGHLVRSEYEKGRGVPCLLAVAAGSERRHARRSASPMRRRSAARAPAVIETTFKEETETDLFGEQAVLCGGLTELIRAGYETLVEAGYSPGDGVLRVPARGEADRRPDLRGRHRQHALLDQQHRRVRRHDARQARHRRRGARRR